MLKQHIHFVDWELNKSVCCTKEAEALFLSDSSAPVA